MVSPQGGLIDMESVEPSWGEDSFGIQAESVILDDALLGVTSVLPTAFLNYFTKLISIDISPLSNVTAIGDFFFTSL